MCHFSILFYLIFLIPEFIKEKNVKIIVFIIIFVLEIIIVLMLGKINHLDGNSLLIRKINNILLFTNSSYTNKDFKNRLFNMLFIFGITTLLYYVEYKKFNTKETFKEIGKVNNTYIMNLYILLLVPFLYYSVDLFRLQLGILFINYIIFSYYYIYSKNKLNKTIYFIIESLIPIILLYRMVLSNGNLQNVLIPLFTNNIF